MEEFGTERVSPGVPFMLVHTFIVDSAAEAVGLIRAKLGPDAVVLNVRKLPAEGVSRWLKKPRLEV